MRRRVIDSNRLIRLWRGESPAPAPVRSEQAARDAVAAWVADNPDSGLVTPVRLELLGGARDEDEVRLTEYFLDLFPLYDKGEVKPDDWAEAERLAKWVPHNGRTRGAIDCLIRAICNRLRCEIITSDTGMPGNRRGR